MTLEKWIHCIIFREKFNEQRLIIVSYFQTGGRRTGENYTPKITAQWFAAFRAIQRKTNGTLFV